MKARLKCIELLWPGKRSQINSESQGFAIDPISGFRLRALTTDRKTETLNMLSGDIVSVHIIVCIKSVVKAAPQGVGKRTPDNSVEHMELSQTHKKKTYCYS